MSTPQSCLIIAPNSAQAREKTKKLAQSFGIDIEKASTDVFLIKATKVEISIEQVRQLKNHIFQKPLQSMYKFVVLENAHNATPEAQNALLKILEEPPKHAIIVLEAQNKALLLPTILSRVTTIKSVPEPKEKSKPELLDQTILEKNLESALEQIATVDDPQEFLDEQIVSLSELLVQSAQQRKGSLNQKRPSQGDSSLKTSQIQKAIEACANAKQMISSNVNPTFVLANLVFILNPQVQS